QGIHSTERGAALRLPKAKQTSGGQQPCLLTTITTPMPLLPRLHPKLKPLRTARTEKQIQRERVRRSKRLLPPLQSPPKRQALSERRLRPERRSRVPRPRMPRPRAPRVPPPPPRTK